MKHLVNLIVLLALVPGAFQSCKKEGNFSTPVTDSTQVTVLLPACRINLEGNNDATVSFANQYQLAYDNAGNLISVLGTKSPSSTIILNATISAKQIDVERDGLGQLVVYDFDQDLFTGLPANYTTTHATVNASQDKSATIAYDSAGRIDKVSGYKKSTSAFIESLDVSYDRAGNANVLTYTYGTAGATSTYTVSSFDNKHNPYDSLKPANLLMYNWDLINADPLQLIQHLSKHNPVAYSLVAYDGTTYSVTLDYQFNDQNYPIQITQTRSDFPSMPVVWNYAYDCQKP